MEKVAQLVKAAKDNYLADNERLGTVGTATRTGAHTGARVGGVVGALGGAAVGALNGASTHGGKFKKAINALALGAGGAIAGAGAGALGGGAAGGSLGYGAGVVRAGKRALYGQESVSKVEHNTRKMLSKSAEEKSNAKKLAGVAASLGGTYAGMHAGSNLLNKGLKNHIDGSIGHSITSMRGYEGAAKRHLSKVKKGTLGMLAGGALLAGSIPAGITGVVKSLKD